MKFRNTWVHSPVGAESTMAKKIKQVNYMSQKYSISKKHIHEEWINNKSLVLQMISQQPFRKLESNTMYFGVLENRCCPELPTH